MPKLAFALLLALHGAIHLLGFVKGSGLAEVEALQRPEATMRVFRDFEGGRLAEHGQATWKLPGGDFTYGEFVLESLRTDPVTERSLP